MANQRYQCSFKGRINHAARQQRYRASRKKVTDHSSKSMTENDVLLSAEASCSKPELQPVMGCDLCHFCKKPVSSFFRLGFLQQTFTPFISFRLNDKKYAQPLVRGGP